MAQKASCFRGFNRLLHSRSPIPSRPRHLRLLFARAISEPSFGSPHAIHEDIDEETNPNYNPNEYHSTYPSQVLNNRYQTITKLGWGFGFTVWLAQDLRQGTSSEPRQSLPPAGTNRQKCEEETPAPQYVAVKIGTCTYGSIAAAQHELKISQHIATANPAHPGAGYIRTPIDSFQIDGPHGVHTCLIYNHMRETLYDFRNRFINQRLSPRILKLYVILLLQGLNYLHSECHMVHTDLKEDNVLVDLENESALEDFVKQQRQIPLPRHVTDDGHTTYLSQSDFGPLRDYFILPEIADLDLAQSGEGITRIHPVQPHRYRAPEVILGTGWSYSADIWNMGVLIWNMMEGKDLFSDLKNEQGNYNANAHLAQMIALIGPPPVALLHRERKFRKMAFTPKIKNPEGQMCENAFQYFGGPFFDIDGEFIRKDLIPRDVDIAETVTLFQGEEKVQFLKFVSRMLQWEPGKRSTAEELIQDQFLELSDDD